jgi:Uma2 family endonuclease
MPAAAALAKPEKTLSQLLKDIGDVPLERIGLPVGSATEQDVIDALEAADKRLFELVDGVLVEKTMGMHESLIASRLVHFFWGYLDDNDRGIAFTADGPIRVRIGRIRMPDAGFISWERFPNQELPEGPVWAVIPDLAADVISKGNTVREMEIKLDDYFKAGVRLVWYIYPKTQTVVVYTSPSSKRELDKDDTLDGGKILPGFKLPVKKLFTRRRKRPNHA